MDKIFRKRNVTRLYRKWQLKTVPRELWKGGLDILVIQEVSWGNGGTDRADALILYAKTNKSHELGIGFLCTRE
jgi:hypothetical protein